MINKKKKSTLGSIVFAAAMLILLFLKMIYMYYTTGMGKYSMFLASASLLIVSLLYLILTVLTPSRATNIVLTVIYIITTILVTAVLVYHNYMGRWPSVAMLKSVWMLGGVKNTVGVLFGIRQFLPLLDLPLWIVYLIIRKKFNSIRNKETSKSRHVVVSAGFAGAFAVLLVIFMLAGGFSFSDLSKEFYIFYGKDIKELIIPSTFEVDKAGYGDTVNVDADYYGLSKGRNVIVIQVEALQDFVIGEEYKGVEITPNLNALIKNDSFYFENYYYQIGGGNTSDAEFTVNNSLYSNENEPSYSKYGKNDYYGLPWILKDNGYHSATAFHAYYADYWYRETAYPYQGFDKYYSLETFEDIDQWSMGLSDRSMFTQTADIIKTFEEPFYSFIITISSHHPYGIPLAERRVDKDNMSPDLFTLYLQSINYFDRALGEFFDHLKESGLYDNSIFVIYGDHYALPNTDHVIRSEVEDLIGESYNMFERFSVPLIIHIPGMGKSETVDTVGGHVDVLPTLLNLLGITNSKGVMFGHNLLDEDYEGVVYEQTHIPRGSFITKDVFYINSPSDPVAYSRDGDKIEDLTQFKEISDKAISTINDCMSLLEENNILYDEEETAKK